MTRDEALRILGLESNATLDDLKKAYRDLVKVIHPDKDSSPGAKQRFILVQDAYELITNDDQQVQDDSARAEKARREREREERKYREKERAEPERQKKERKEQQDREAYALGYFKTWSGKIKVRAIFRSYQGFRRFYWTYSHSNLFLHMLIFMLIYGYCEL